MSTGITMKFYNEEFLLPFWLKHHREIFDVGILINWHSTDNSVDICKELVPDWKIITPKEKQFSTVNGDVESTKAEIMLGKGMWKCTLNVTEFFLCPNVHTMTQIAQDNKCNVIYPERVAALVDRPDYVGYEIDSDKSLILQCSNGIIVPRIVRGERSVNILPHVYDGLAVKNNREWTCVHHRIMHNQEHGRYTKGFHRSKLNKKDRLIASQYYIVWFLYAPWTYVRHRIYQWKGRKPKSDLEENWGTHHFRSPEEVDKRFEDLSWRMECVFDDRRYKDTVARWEKNMEEYYVELKRIY